MNRKQGVWRSFAVTLFFLAGCNNSEADQVDEDLWRKKQEILMEQPVRYQVVDTAQNKADKEVARFFSGRKVVYANDREADTGFTELYFPNGHWRYVLMGEGPSIMDGTWNVQNGKICVKADDNRFSNKLKKCRTFKKESNDTVSNFLDPRNGPDSVYDVELVYMSLNELLSMIREEEIKEGGAKRGDHRHERNHTGAAR